MKLAFFLSGREQKETGVVSQPAKHAPHHPTKSTASREFSNRMELLPTTTL